MIALPPTPVARHAVALALAAQPVVVPESVPVDEIRHVGRCAHSVLLGVPTVVCQWRMLVLEQDGAVIREQGSGIVFGSAFRPNVYLTSYDVTARRSTG